MRAIKRCSVVLLILAGLLASASGRASAQLPDQAYVSGVVGHAQTYSLSCEARSASDWAGYWGVYVDETDFLNRLPRSDNPDAGFVGNPNDAWGSIPPNSYGVHAGPVAELLRSYGLDAHAGLGLGWDEVRAEIAAGRPVIVWVIGSIWSGESSKYKTQDGQKVTVAHNEHTMIVIGYDPNSVQLVDALTGYTVTHPLDNFLASWGVLGNMAIIGNGSSQESGADTQSANTGGSTNGDSYIVQHGDTLNKVAARFDLYWPDLAAWNGISYPYLIYPGQTLLLSEEGQAGQPQAETTPEPQTYTVERGDYLQSVAQGLGADWIELAQLNHIAPPFSLVAGDSLQIPDGKKIQTPDVPEIYTAARSESLVAIAEYYGLDWFILSGANNISFPYMLTPGQTIQFK